MPSSLDILTGVAAAQVAQPQQQQPLQQTQVPNFFDRPQASAVYQPPQTQPSRSIPQNTAPPPQPASGVGPNALTQAQMLLSLLGGGPQNFVGNVGPAFGGAGQFYTDKFGGGATRTQGGGGVPNLSLLDLYLSQIAPGIAPALMGNPAIAALFQAGNYGQTPVNGVRGAPNMGFQTTLNQGAYGPALQALAQLLAGVTGVP